MSCGVPVIGSLINLVRKTSGISNTDLQNKKYIEFKKRIVTLAQENSKVIFTSGHEHNLQYIVEDNIVQIKVQKHLCFFSLSHSTIFFLLYSLIITSKKFNRSILIFVRRYTKRMTKLLIILRTEYLPNNAIFYLSMQI